MKDTNNAKKKLEEALKAERDKLKNILDAMDDGVYIINKDFYIEYANPVLERGFGPAEGRRCVEYFGIPDTEQPCPCHRFQEPISKDEIKGRSEWYSPKNRKTYDVFQTPITNEDGSETYLQIMHDITERKRTEEELRKSEKRFSDIAENAMDWTWETDVKGKYTYSSHVVEKILGYTPEEVLGKHFFDFLHVDEREQTRKRLNEVFSRKESFMNVINKKVHKDGRVLTCETSGVPVIDKDGRLIGYRGSVRDITERKRAEEELDVKARELDMINRDLHNLAMEMTTLEERERKRFAGMLHDDIGQNLAAARLAFSSFTKLCDRCSDTARETMDEVNSLLESTIDTIRAMVPDLYSVHPYGEELVSKRGLKDAIEWYAKTVLVQPGVELAVDIDGAVEEMPEDFKQNLYRIVQECLQNVMKHSKASSVELRCKVEGESLRVSVKDDGVGFDDIRLKEGGFGLRLMRERIRSMNGILTIRSGRDKGTEVLAEFSTQQITGG